LQKLEELIAKFYTAFQNKDWKTMQSCYHDDVVFSDPVFQNLRGNEAKAMWHMLVTAGKDLTMNFSKINADNKSGSCHWEAFYSFSRTGRNVHNVIDAKFKFKDGKIFRHTDTFNLWRWSGMALGIVGMLLGWCPLIKNRVRSLAQHNLRKFMEANGY
jgi:hypothetical protein